MTMEPRRCLICDQTPTVGIIAVTADAVGLCGPHWAEYEMDPEGATAQEVDKYFGDCGETVKERAGRQTILLHIGGRRTDETQARRSIE